VNIKTLIFFYILPLSILILYNIFYRDNIT